MTTASDSNMLPGASRPASPFASLFESIGLQELVPASLAAWRPLIDEAMGAFLEHLPEARLAAIIADQFALAPDAPPAARAAALLAHCPTLHKLGQVIARHHELDPELRQHLQQLESMPGAISIPPIAQRIRAEFGVGSRLFLADAALAEGSVAVVLPFCWWEDGRLREAVFKVLKPGIAEQLAQELALLPDLAALLARRGAQLGLPAIDYRGHFTSIQHLLTQEIHLEVEQANMRAAANLLGDDGDVFVPRLLPWCTPAITAMERVDGTKVTDAAVSERQGRALGRRMIAALLAKPFWSQDDPAMFHGDLHAGNLMLAEDGRLAVLDWSLTARLAKVQREAIVRIALGGLALDERQICEGLASLGMHDTGSPVLAEGVGRALDQLVASGRPVSFDWLVALLDGLALQGASGFGEQLAVFRKTWLSLSGVLRDLGADIAADVPLLDVGLQQFFAEMPARMITRPDSRAFSTHVSTADLIGFATAAWPASMRYWARALGWG